MAKCPCGASNAAPPYTCPTCQTVVKACPNCQGTGIIVHAAPEPPVRRPAGW